MTKKINYLKFSIIAALLVALSILGFFGFNVENASADITSLSRGGVFPLSLMDKGYGLDTSELKSDVAYNDGDINIVADDKDGGDVQETLDIVGLQNGTQKIKINYPSVKDNNYRLSHWAWQYSAYGFKDQTVSQVDPGYDSGWAKNYLKDGEFSSYVMQRDFAPYDWGHHRTFGSFKVPGGTDVTFPLFIKCIFQKHTFLISNRFTIIIFIFFISIFIR